MLDPTRSTNDPSDPPVDDEFDETEFLGGPDDDHLERHLEEVAEGRFEPEPGNPDDAPFD